MSNIENNLKVKVTKEVSVPICTADFFGKYQFPEKYAIVKIEQGCFSITKIGQNECNVFFKTISELLVGRYCYLIEFEDNTKALVKFEEGIIFVSEPFKDIIKFFKNYILVKDLGGERKLVPLIYFRNVSFCMWTNSRIYGKEKADNHAIMELPNNRKTILLREGLITSDIEFDSVLDGTCELDKVFRIVIFEDENKSAVVTIENWKVSERFKKIDYISFNGNYCKNVVQAKVDDGKTVLVRISDFKQSKCYDKVTLLSLNYAEVTDENKTYILRLSDFAIALWPEDQKS